MHNINRLLVFPRAPLQISIDVNRSSTLPRGAAQTRNSIGHQFDTSPLGAAISCLLITIFSILGVLFLCLKELEFDWLRRFVERTDVLADELQLQERQASNSSMEYSICISIFTASRSSRRARHARPNCRHATIFHGRFAVHCSEFTK